MAKQLMTNVDFMYNFAQYSKKVMRTKSTLIDGDFHGIYIDVS